MDNGTLGTDHGFHRAVNQRVLGGRHDLDGHIIGHQVLFDQVADKVEFDLRRSRKADLDFLKTDVQ